MRSGTSFFDWTIFKKTICRFWPLWGVYFAIWLVMLPLNGLMMLRLGLEPNAFPGGYMDSFAWTTVPSYAARGYGTFLAVTFGVLCAMAVFSHLYSARSANLFGSLPVRREGLFLTHYLAGLAFLIVPNAVIFLLTLLVEAAGGVVFWQGLGFWLAVVCGEGFFFYSLAVFCGLFTGHILALPAFYAIVNCIVIGVTGLLHIVLDAFYYGFAGFTDEVYDVVKWFTPVVLLDEAVTADLMGVAVPKENLSPGDLAIIAQRGGIWTSGNSYLTLRGLGTVGVYALAALALTACALLLYRARRMESAGDVVSVKAMRPVFKYGMAFCVGLVFGMGTTFFIGGGEVTLMISILVWGVIGYFAAQMLLDKSFRVFKKWRGALAVSAVFAVLFLVVAFDLTGFETRIPDPAGVNSVYASGIDVVYLADYGDNLAQNIADPEVIRLLTILHREAVAQRDEERQTQNQIGGVSTSLELTYRLKGGGSLTRQYTLWLNPNETDREGTAAWAVQQIYDNHELYWQVYGFDSLEESLAEGQPLKYVSYEGYDKEGQWTNAVYSGRDALTLLSTVKEDFFAGRIGVRRVDDRENWQGGRPEKSLTFIIEGLMGGEGRRVSIALQDTAASTLAALEEMAARAEIPETKEFR